MDTFGNKTVRICHKEESWSINESFLAKEDIPNYAIVTLNADGTVSNAKLGTDIPLGIVSAGNKAGELVTVQTQYNAILDAKASGAVALGDEVAVAGLNADKVYHNYAKAVSGDHVVGLALSAGADGEVITVGIYRVFKILA